MDHEARECYEKHVDELLRFASSLVGPTGAEDLVSSMFLKVFASDGWTRSTSVRGYLYSSLVNVARSQHRSTQRRLKREARQYVAGASEHDSDLTPEVLEAIRHLSVRQRAVVFLTYWDDLTPAEIAERLGISRQTVSRELLTSRSLLRRWLA